MDSKNNGSFWPSYVDIMTTLFAITLVLFAVSFSRFKIKEKQLKSLVDQYENILTVYSTVGKIDSTRYFNYNEEYLKHLFTIDVEYQRGEFQIDRLSQDLTNHTAADKIRKDIIAAGITIKNAIESLKNSGRSNIRFLVVIEGQASKVAFNTDAWHNNYTLSYLRARHLNEFWISHGIDISKIPYCELIVSGSGEGGVPRFVPDEASLHKQFPNTMNYREAWLREESKNQRFLIHIVPVIGNIDGAMEELNRIKGKKK